MRIKYCCYCQSEPVEIVVTDRLPQGDLIDWMEGCVAPSISVDHRARSPLCQAQEIAQVMIPMDGDQVGVPPVKN